MRCSNCGASLKISADQEYFACGYCGTEQIVESKGGTVYLKPIIDAIRKVQLGTDKTASEMALKRLTVELSNINNDIEHLEKRRPRSDQTEIQIGPTAMLVLFAASFPIGAFIVLSSPLSSQNLIGNIVWGVFLMLIGGGCLFGLYTKRWDRKHARQRRSSIDTELQDAWARRFRIEEEIAKHRVLAAS